MCFDGYVPSEIGKGWIGTPWALGGTSWNESAVILSQANTPPRRDLHNMPKRSRPSYWSSVCTAGDQDRWYGSIVWSASWRAWNAEDWSSVGTAGDRDQWSKSRDWSAGWRGWNVPFVGEWLKFNYPYGIGFKHFFYDCFPAGRKVRPAVALVDLHASIQVEEVREAMGHHGEVYAAVRFTTTNGTVVWTNVRRGKHFWMKSV